MSVITRQALQDARREPYRGRLVRFADNLYPVNHRALQQLVGVEARPVVLNLAPDPVDRGQDVRQTLTVVSHKATASARTRSRMRAFRPRGVATST